MRFRINRIKLLSLLTSHALEIKQGNGDVPSPDNYNFWEYWVKIPSKARKPTKKVTKITIYTNGNIPRESKVTITLNKN